MKKKGIILFLIIILISGLLTAVIFGFKKYMEHFEAVKRDARAYHGTQRLRTGAVGFGHGTYCHLHDTLLRATPTGVNSTEGMMGCIIQEHGDAVGC